MSKNKVKKKGKPERLELSYEDDFSCENLREEEVSAPLVFSEELTPEIHRVISQDLAGTEDKSEFRADVYSRDEEVKILQDKLNQVNSKYHKCQNTCLSLRHELNKTQKLLRSEVGDNVTISSLLNHPGGWKGRAEQIQQLQQKLSELHQRLGEKSEKSARNSAISLERRNSYRTKSIERDRKTQMENLSRELRQMEIALESNKKKLEAARARIKVLENETSDSKRNIIILNDRKIHDDQLIEALNGQLRAVEDRFRERDSDSKCKIDKISHECSIMKNEVQSSRLQIEQLRKKISERETEIHALRLDRVSQVNPNPRESNVFGCSSEAAINPQDSNEYVVLGLAAEAERERLVEVVAVLNRRLDKERADADHLSELLRREKTKIIKLEHKLQKIEAEMVARPRVNSGYRSRSSKSLTSSKSEWSDDQFRNKLELLEEENLAVKARLATLQQEKTEDLSRYKQLLENTRRIFHDSLRGKISTAHSTLTI
ncbi:myosin-11 isoform X1 [Fopius arisanus]|uniref:Myosin-11 isoform X1 n=1 Tax=Fopius arisanus TaxID=64838 RepID=A0A9R1TL16_9HYME|nr:PREDICTED: myosin-11-like isoform X1 [Fopius arisanus]